MSVLSEKNAVKAAFITIMSAAVAGAGAANVQMYILPEPCKVWPQIVLARPHWTLTALLSGAGNVKGNEDGDPNRYTWKYFDQLSAQSGITVEAIMDTHDAFLEQVVAYFQSVANQYLPDFSGTRQVEASGETITSDANEAGPYELAAGSAALISEGMITIKGLQRYPTA